MNENEQNMIQRLQIQNCKRYDSKQSWGTVVQNTRGIFSFLSSFFPMLFSDMIQNTRGAVHVLENNAKRAAQRAAARSRGRRRHENHPPAPRGLSAADARDWPWHTVISVENDDAQLLTLSGLKYITSMKLTMKYELMSVLYH